MTWVSYCLADSVFLVLNSWLQLQINILFSDNSRVILRGLKLTKRMKINKILRWLIATWKITQMYECLVTLAVSKQLSSSRKNFNKIGFIKYCFCIINSSQRGIKRKQACNVDTKHLEQYFQLPHTIPSFANLGICYP